MGEIKSLKPEDYVIQYACCLRTAKEALKGVSPEERPARESEYRQTERNLFRSVDIYRKKNRFES